MGNEKCERRKVNVLEMKCLRSLVGVPRMYRVMNEEVFRRAGIDREFASRADGNSDDLGMREEWTLDNYRMARKLVYPLSVYCICGEKITHF